MMYPVSVPVIRLRLGEIVVTVIFVLQREIIRFPLFRGALPVFEHRMSHGVTFSLLLLPI